MQYYWRKMCEINLSERIKIKFFCEYWLKILAKPYPYQKGLWFTIYEIIENFNVINVSKYGDKMYTMIQEVAIQRELQKWIECEPWCFQSEVYDRCWYHD